MIGSYLSNTRHAANTRALLAILRWGLLSRACESVLVYAFLTRRGNPNVGNVGSGEYHEPQYPKKELRVGGSGKTGGKKELKWYILEMLTGPCVSKFFFGDISGMHSGGITV